MGLVSLNLCYCLLDDFDLCDLILINKVFIVNWVVVLVNGLWFLFMVIFGIDVYVSDFDGSVVKVVFYFDNYIIVIEIVGFYYVVVSGFMVGVYMFSVVVWDNQGCIVQFGNVMINVCNLVIVGNIDSVFSSGFIFGWVCLMWLLQLINVDLYVGGLVGIGIGVGCFLVNKVSEVVVVSVCSVGSGSYCFQIQFFNEQCVVFSGCIIYIYGILFIGVVNSFLGVLGNFSVFVVVCNVQFSVESYVMVMLLGEFKSYMVQMCNIGNYIWIVVINFRFGFQNFVNNFIWGVVCVNVILDVVFGQIGIFNFMIKVFIMFGVYNMQWQMLQENVVWFGDLIFN